ncbi:MAG: hypothetical protein H6620_08660 [Halobacteriovoraceae bacterium]|nr:hypothetical protein [Halobacteriovoraceae bacterium]
MDAIGKGDHEKIVQNYFQELIKFKKKVCSYKELHQYEKLYQEYQGRGHYIPLVDEQVDTDAILSNLYLVQAKKRWLNDLYFKLKKMKRLPDFSRDLKNLQRKINENLVFKYQHEVKNEYTPQMVKALKKNVTELKNIFRKLEKKAFYLFNFGYPVNHFAHRFEYEKYKELEGPENKKKANKIFVKRKIYEDGAFHPQQTGTDKFLRTALDTVKLELFHLDGFIHEDLRYDLEWIIEQLDELNKKGKQYFLVRIKAWKEKIEDSLKFYNQIAIQTNPNKNVTRKYASAQYKATQDIKNFVLDKFIEVYKYWADKDELMRKLFVLDTILLNEVGAVDPEGLEREEIIKVVMNRKSHSEYSLLDPKQDLYEFLYGDINTKKYPWLNILFRKGEFSFTYFFIPAVTNVFCPPMTKWSKNLREDNLLRSLKYLTQNLVPEDQKALRYFSRASMVGRVNMAKVWVNYRAIVEKLGREVEEGTDRLDKHLKKGQFRYFYSFNRGGKVYRVLEIDEQKYVYLREGTTSHYYVYRDPQLFRFFEEISN